jgi:hypothetical protein
VLQEVDPEEEFEGYTGNEGMTLDRWYRHAAIFIWPTSKHFDILCDAGSRNAAAALALMVKQWRQAGKKKAADLKADCVAFATALIARWQANPSSSPFGYDFDDEDLADLDFDDEDFEDFEDFEEEANPDPLLPSLAALDEPELIRSYLSEVLIKDASLDPGEALVAVCKKHGWATFQPELEVLFQKTTNSTLWRNIRVLEPLCLEKPQKKQGWAELCQALGTAAIAALEAIDQGQKKHSYRATAAKKVEVVTGLARAFLATEQVEALSRLVDHLLARPKNYPLTEVHVAALTALAPWLKKNVKKRCPPLAKWFASCRAQLEELTAQEPQQPADFRRDAAISCKCQDCAELKRFLRDPKEQVHRFRAAEGRRRHLEDRIRQHKCDLDRRTEKKGSPYTLVCTKNTASYRARLKKYHEDQKHLATLRVIEDRLPK